MSSVLSPLFRKQTTHPFGKFLSMALLMAALLLVAAGCTSEPGELQASEEASTTTSPTISLAAPTQSEDLDPATEGSAENLEPDENSAIEKRLEEAVLNYWQVSNECLSRPDLCDFENSVAPLIDGELESRLRVLVGEEKEKGHRSRPGPHGILSIAAYKTEMGPPLQAVITACYIDDNILFRLKDDGSEEIINDTVVTGMIHFYLIGDETTDSPILLEYVPFDIERYRPGDEKGQTRCDA